MPLRKCSCGADVSVSMTRCRPCNALVVRRYRSTTIGGEKSREACRRYYASNKESMNEASRNRWAVNKSRYTSTARAGRLRLRREMIAAYGYICKCCGESEPRFLTIEHKLKDGADHRKFLKGGPDAVYRDLKRRGWPQDYYSLLCMNCNWSERNCEPCPHKAKRANTA